MDSTAPLLELHQLADEPDDSPLHLISEKLLAHYRRCERELLALTAARREQREAED
jgi:hypothetical protein